MKKGVVLLLVLIIVLALVVGAALFFTRNFKTTASITPPNEKVVKNKISSENGVAQVSAIQEELDRLSEQMVADLQSERRLNLNMVGTLRANRQMIDQIQNYAVKVEKQIDIIEEIAKDEFQEDVKLQASLFTGKKADLVAKHLEEFRAARVGAILAKMKEKEASAVLDIWAKASDPRISAFYRETMAAYLNNRRRDMHPELFESKSDSSVAQK